MPTLIKPEQLEYRHDAFALEQFDLLTLSPRLGELTNSRHFVFDIRKLEPGKYSFPYHFHRNAEELILILSGSMTVRTPEGFQIAKKGHIIFCEMGETSAHQFYNHESVPCVYLDLRTTIGVDICEYPDSGKINIAPYQEVYEIKSQVEYNKGEEEVELIWQRLKANLAKRGKEEKL